MRRFDRDSGGLGGHQVILQPVARFTFHGLIALLWSDKSIHYNTRQGATLSGSQIESQSRFAHLLWSSSPSLQINEHNSLPTESRFCTGYEYAGREDGFKTSVYIRVPWPRGSATTASVCAVGWLLLPACWQSYEGKESRRYGGKELERERRVGRGGGG
jgi:hypothetical protein